ncbi:PaaI family thioesterase [Pseudonocardia sp. GCM10023141]|uniref:PaaI family thioesterase n=1 Tax=Pseudonocardia sp. GCM10023141 TaxID=3252653 RepID=UPI0036139BCD
MSISTMERLQAIVAGALPLAPVAATFGMSLADVQRGRSVGRIQPLPVPVLQGAGPVLVLGDMALSVAIASTLTEHQHITTLTMHLTGLSRPRPGSALEAVARVEHSGADFAVATATVHDDDGATVALVSCRSAMFTARSDSGETRQPFRTVPDPLAAMGVATATEGDATVATMAALPALGNSGNAVQGGVLAALAAHAVDAAIAGERPQLAASGTDLEVTFLRGVPTDGAAVAARAELEHAGSRFASARAEVCGAGGKPALLVTGARWRG